MKTTTLHILFFLFCVHLSFAQFPLGINYQAAIRNQGGAILANQNVGMRFTILRSATNNIVYRETQNTSTNEFGIVNLVIGKGTVVTGRFDEIDWPRGGLKVRIEIDPTGGFFYELFAESELQTVPFAFAADRALNLDQTARITASQIANSGATNGQVLRWNGNFWAPSADNTFTLTTSSRFTGGGTVASPLELAAQGATAGQVLKWDGNSWAPADESTTVYVAGTGININANTKAISAQNTQPIWNANLLRGTNISPATPTIGQFMAFDGGSWAPVSIQTGVVLPFDGTGEETLFPVFRITNNSGVAIQGRGNIGVRATFQGAGAGTALEIQNGGIRVTGNNKPGFQVGGIGTITINSPLSNSNPSALVFVTQINPNPAANERAYPFSISYSFALGMWQILSDPNVSLNYNVLIINQ